MAYIQKRIGKEGGTSYRVQVRLKGSPVQSATFRRLTDAKRWAAQTEVAIREGRYFKTMEAQRHTVGEMIDRYVEEVLPGKSKSREQTSIQRRQLLWWKDKLGDYLLSDLTGPLISKYRDLLTKEKTHLGTQRKPQTANRFLAALSHCLTVAANNWEWLSDSPMRKVERFKEPRGRDRYLEDDERSRLLDACRNSSNTLLYPIVIVALITGARRGEILSLTWDNVDLDRQRVTFRDTKNGEIRVVPLVGPALDEMWKLSEARRLDTRFCFPSNDGRKPAHFREAWSRAVKKAEIEDFTFHDLRHSCASYLIMNGASLAEVATVLGHKTIQMTMRYAHLSEVHTAGVVKHMADEVFGSGSK